MNIADFCVAGNITVKEAIKKLDETARKVLIVTEGLKLKGTVTDGDIRRWILKNGDLNNPVSHVMNASPKYVPQESVEAAKNVFIEKQVEAVPVVNEEHEVVDIIFWNDKFESRPDSHGRLNNAIVIMAGGKGTRLAPYTNIIPKPLIPIGDQTIIERIIDRFTRYGCDQFYLTVNYKKNMIKAHFNELERDYAVHYVEEDEPCGTAGSLSLLEGKLTDTFFVSNCDILIDGDYSDMVQYHKKNKNKITMVASLKHYTIPYGVVAIDQTSQVQQLIEKPEYDYLVNTGMYLLEPETLSFIPKHTFFHITELINLLIESGEKVGVYPVSDNSWLDMGQMKEMENMIDKLGIKS